MHPLAILDIVGLGGLLAYCYYFHEEWLRGLLRNKIFTAFVFAQLAVVILFRVFQHFNMYYDILDRASFGLFSVWLIGRAVFGVDGVGGYILNSSPLQYIGKISYAVYLIHPLVPGMLLGLKYPTEPLLRFCLYAIVTIAICSLTWYCFEKPILKLKDKFE